MPKDPLLLRTLRHETIERPPVWLMRQAGRYLPEYRALKEQHGFLGLCRSPELATEVTIQPVRIFDLDAAILFADIMLPAECLGFQIDFTPGPTVANPVRSAADISGLIRRDVAAHMGYVFDAVKMIRGELNRLHSPEPKTLIGFAGAPWTLACYLLDQGPYKHFAGTQVFGEESPETLHRLLAMLSELTAEYLIGQIESGAQMVQLFDTWGGNLSEDDYRRWALPYVRRVFETVGTRCPRALYINGSAHLLSAMVESGADCLSVDWRTSLSAAREACGGKLAIQGNLDPAHLFGEQKSVVARTREMIAGWGPHRGGYVANLGHGVLQRTPRENVAAFVATVKEGWR